MKKINSYILRWRSTRCKCDLALTFGRMVGRVRCKCDLAVTFPGISGYERLCAEMNAFSHLYQEK